MINLLTVGEITRVAYLATIIGIGILGGFVSAWFIYKEVIKDLRNQIKEMNAAIHKVKPRDNGINTRL